MLFFISLFLNIIKGWSIKFINILTICLLIHAQTVYSEEEVLIVVHEWRPFTYIDKASGELRGLAVELVDFILKETKVSYKQQLLIWSDAYSIVIHTPNACIYPIGRFEARAHLFAWLAPIGHKLQSYIWSLEENAHFDGKAIIGVPRDSIDHIYLTVNKTYKNPVRIYENENDMIDAFFNEEVNFIAEVEDNLTAIAESKGFSRSKIFKVKALNEFQTYIACNNQFDQKLFLKMKRAASRKLNQ